jgi:hypothetical protein
VTLTLSNVRLVASPRLSGWTRLTGALHSDVDGVTEDVWLEVRDQDAEALTVSGDSFLAWLAPLASLRHEALQLDAPVDALLLEHVREVVRVWCSWYPQMDDVRIDAPATAAPAASGRIAASMFTGGVDSFFTVLRHDAGEGTPSTVRISDLLYIHGFDVPLANMAAWTHVTSSLQRAADALHKRLVLAASNLRDTRFGATDWPRLSHGAALAGVGHALGARYDTILIGSSAGYRDLRFWGSHPLTDPMFTSSVVRILHDGAAFMRAEKTAYVSRSAIALRHLRVCWKSTAGDNCGECNNCYRTMLALDALGVLDECATFDRASLDMERAAHVFCRYDFDVRQFGYVIDLAHRAGRPDIVKAVTRSLAGSQQLMRRLALVRTLRAQPLARRWADTLERRLMRGWID